MASDRGTPRATEQWPADAVEVGRILDAWGLKGWIKLQPFAAEPQALLSSTLWHLQPPAHATSATAWPATLHITQARTHGENVVASARELTDRDGARALRGARVFVARSSFPAAADDEYYWVDLIGSEVVNRQGDPLGRVSALIDTGPHSVLCVRRPDAGPEVPAAQAERLIPFVAAYVDAVDTTARRIQVDWALDY
ncbi:MAG TPA: ribosome maturation factor RimM [Burkholderiaceae bacterium]|nr:ribosome maturation factor RimM [Burkholderiaceae bacterium]